MAAARNCGRVLPACLPRRHCGLALRLPMGYVRHPSGEVMKDPDEQARASAREIGKQAVERRRLQDAALVDQGQARGDLRRAREVVRGVDHGRAVLAVHLLQLGRTARRSCRS